jgi:hypothetical protein
MIVPLARLSYKFIEIPSIALGKLFYSAKGFKPAL